jgi:hypothetical protein
MIPTPSNIQVLSMLTEQCAEVARREKRKSITVHDFGRTIYVRLFTTTLLYYYTTIL